MIDCLKLVIDSNFDKKRYKTRLNYNINTVCCGSNLYGNGNKEGRRAKWKTDGNNQSTD